MAKRITVSDDTIQKIEPFAKPFEKFDDCIKRILDCKCRQETKKPKQNDDAVKEKP